MTRPTLKQPGCEHAYALELQRPRQSPLALLLNLPRELRGLIYEHYDLDWSSVNSAMGALEHDIESIVFKDRDKSRSFYHTSRSAAYALSSAGVSIAPRSTPTLLLICRQVTDEALEVLRKKPLTVGPPLALVPKDLWPLQVTAFVGAHTLRVVRHLILSPDDRGRSWCDRKTMGYRAYIHPTTIAPWNHQDGKRAFERFEVEDLRAWLWGLRDALKHSRALESLTVQFRNHHKARLKELYYSTVVSELVTHLPLVNLILPEDDAVAEELLCDLYTTS